MADIDLTPPKGVQEEAQRGLDWREEYGRGGTDVGIARARDLSNGRSVSEDTIRRMVSFFDRHEAYESAHDETEADGGPSNARISWALWGGDAGRSWAESKRDQLDAAKTKASFSRPAVAPLRKQVAYAGRFVDATGQKVELTPERFRDAVRGSQRLLDAGFKIRGFTSHFTDDSRDVLGTWTGLWAAGDSLGGIFEPHSEEARQLALDLDSSMVLEEDVQLPSGEVIPLAITRIDIVPQGAVFGTSRFEEFARYVAKGRPLAALSSRRVLIQAAMKEKEPAMKPELTKALAAALGMDVAGEIDESQLVEMLDEKLELQDGEDREEALARAFARAFADPSSESEEKMACDAPAKSEMQTEDPEAKAQMSALRAEVRQLQDDKANAMLATVDAKDRKRLFSRFTALRDKAGPELAFETLSDLVGAQAKADPVGAKLSSLAGRGAAVTTPRKEGAARNSDEEKLRQAKATMRASLAARTGAKLDSFKDHD